MGVLIKSSVDGSLSFPTEGARLARLATCADQIVEAAGRLPEVGPPISGLRSAGQLWLLAGRARPLAIDDRPRGDRRRQRERPDRPPILDRPHRRDQGARTRSTMQHWAEERSVRHTGRLAQVGRSEARLGITRAVMPPRGANDQDVARLGIRGVRGGGRGACRQRMPTSHDRLGPGFAGWIGRRRGGHSRGSRAG